MRSTKITKNTCVCDAFPLEREISNEKETCKLVILSKSMFSLIHSNGM